MYERFTDLAREVMRLANQSAQRLIHEYIGTEHILLAVLKVADGVAVKVLKNCSLTTEAVREAVLRIVRLGDVPVAVMGRLPHTFYAKQALTWAEEEARFLNHDFVCTEHLLMGLLHAAESGAARVLMQLGLTVDRAREEVVRLSPPGRKIAQA